MVMTEPKIRRAVCPGSFDPVTKGHLDMIGRAATLFDDAIVAVGKDVGKRALFTAEERIAMIRKGTKRISECPRRGPRRAARRRLRAARRTRHGEGPARGERLRIRNSKCRR